MLLSDPVMNQMFKSARMHYKGVFPLPAGNGFTVPFTKDGVEHVVRVKLTRMNNYGVRIPKAAIKDRLAPVQANPAHIRWHMQSDVWAEASNYPDYIMVGSRASSGQAETVVALILANIKDQEDDGEPEVRAFSTAAQARAAAI